MTTARRVLLMCAAVCAWGALGTPAAGAHPLGNFTINRFAGLEITTSRIVVHYVVDMAEIPTFQETAIIDRNGDGSASSEELAHYASATGERIAGRLDLSAAGRRVPLSVTRSEAALRPGQGGLDVLRIEVDALGRLQSAKATVEYRDGNFAGRSGWGEVIAYGTDGQGVASSTVPSTSVSDRLRAYPRGRDAEPPRVTSASVTVSPAAGAGTRAITRESRRPARDPLAGAFSSLVESDLSPAPAILAVAVALGAGAMHALGPGHGKTVMAAYLMGSEGKARHAVAVGIAVSLMHTASVVGLGLVTLWASSQFPPESVYPWLSLASGIVVLALGAWLLGARIGFRRLRLAPQRGRPQVHRRDPEPGHSHPHGHHLASSPGHPSDGAVHEHGFGAHRHDAPVPASPLSWKGLGAIAVSGGLLPSPTALVALLGAVALHRVAFGVVLVTAFSVGLAGALTLLGLLVLRARAFARRKLGRRTAAVLPLLSASAICAMGAFLTARAAAGL
jgi:ABC-type nickel/cobalt efflux system permease component RcnA